MKNIDDVSYGEEEKKKIIEKLLSEIREKHLEYIKKFGEVKSEN